MMAFLKGIGAMAAQIIVAEIVLSSISYFKQSKKKVKK
jgi:hypothetical protein